MPHPSGRRRVIGTFLAALLLGTGAGVALPAAPAAFAITRTLTVVSGNVDESGTSPGACAGPPLGVLGVCTLQAAIQDAQLLMGGGDDVIIQFAPSLNGVVFQPGSGLGTANPAMYYGDVPAGRTLEIRGPAAPATAPILDGAGLNRLFDFTGSGTVRINNVTMRNGRTEVALPAGPDGAVIRTTTVLSLDTVRMASSFAGGEGGFVSTNNDLSIVNSTLDDGIGDTNGGAIAIRGAASDLRIDSTTILNSDNFGGGGQGGGVYCDDCGSVSVQNSAFTTNNGRNGGGAIFATGAAVQVASTTFTNNQAFNGEGGAIFAGVGAAVEVDGSTFTGNNSLSLQGGAISCDCESVTINGSAFRGNSASTEAGALYAPDGLATAFITDTEFSGNTAGVQGGAIRWGGLQLSLKNSTFDGNSASFSGGAVWTTGVVDLKGVRVSNNNAFQGGGVTAAAATLSIGGTVFAGNTATGDGGGLYCATCSTPDITATTFSDNGAGARGGAVFLDATGNPPLLDVTFSGNTAVTGGEAIFLTTSTAGIPTVLDITEGTIANHRAEGPVVPAITVDPAAVSSVTVQIRNSILADNELNCSLPVGASVNGAGTTSIVEGGNCAWTNGTAVNTDPALLPLAEQGGSTFTGVSAGPGASGATGRRALPVHAIDGESAADDLVACINTFDARGATRSTAACDAGAFELGLRVTATNAATQFPSQASIVSLADVPNDALLQPTGNGAADSQALTTAQVRGIDLESTPLRNIPLRNIGLTSIDLSREVLDAISLAEIPLSYPGGWEAYLTFVGQTQLASQPLNTVTLLQVLDATANLPADRQLDIGQLDLSGTPLGTLSIGAIALGGAPLAELAGSSTIDWCATYIEPFTTTPCDDTPGSTTPGAIDTETATLVSLSLEGIPLRNIPLRNIPLRNIDLNSVPLRNIPLRNIPLRNIDLSVSPLRNIPLRNIPLRNIPIVDSQGNVYDLNTIVAAPLRNIPLRNIPLRNIGNVAASPLRNIPLRNIDLTASPLRNIPLRNIPLRNIDIDASPLRNIPLRNIPLRNIGTVAASPLRNIPLRNIPLRNIPLRNIGGLEASPLRNIPLRNIDLSSSPLRNIPLRNITTVASLVDCTSVDCSPTSTLTLGDVAVLLSTATLGLLADGVADTTDLGILGDITFDADQPFVLGDIADAFQSLPDAAYTLQALLQVFASDTDGTYTLGDLAQALADDPIGLQSIYDLLFDALTIQDLLNVLLADPARFGIDPTAALGVRDGVQNLTIDDLIALLALLEPPVTLADLFLGVVAPEDYPWEAIDLDAAADGLRQSTNPDGIPFTIGVTSTLPAAQIDVTFRLPAGFSFVPGSLSLPLGATIAGEPLVEKGTDGSSVVSARVSMPELPQGGTQSPMGIRVLAPLSVGDTGAITAEVEAPEWRIGASTSDSYRIADALETNDTPATASPLANPADTLVISHLGTTGDVDWFRLPVVQGQELSLILSNLPVDYDMLLFAPAAGTTLRGSAVRTLVPAADNGLSLLGDDAVVAQIAPDVDTTAPPGYRLLEGSARRGTDDERIDTTPLAAGSYLLKISGYNGASAPRPYVLRTRIDGLSVGQECPAVTTPVGAPLPLGSAVTTVTPATDTLVLVDTARLQRSYPATNPATVGSAADVVTALGAFTDALANPVPADRFAGTRAAVVDLATVATVRTANAALDAQPCNPERSNAVVAAIGAHLDTLLAQPNASGIRNIVIVGADDQIPMARLTDNTPAHNEQEYAETWVDASPVAASNALGYMLSDDPYGTSRPFAVGARELYVPDLAVGRLVETPKDITTALTNFTTFGGRLDPQTALSTGYDFLEDGARSVAQELQAAAVVPTVDQSLISTGLDAWTKAQLDQKFAEAGPDVASVNAHFDHYRALPADQDAAGRLTDPLTVDDVRTAPDLAGGTRPLRSSIIFSMGCHAGLSVSDINVASLSTDWAQTFGAQGAAAFAGNTGYGYGDTDVVAFSEELMRLFAARLTKAPTIGAAMAAAKQRYVSDLAVVSPFEEKVTSQVIFYGLPMYRIAGASVPQPEPFRAVSADPLTGLASATVTLAPTATSVTTANGTYYRIGREVQATAYQPVQPRTSVDVTAAGRIARGALITGLVSRDEPGLVNPVVVTPTDDVTGTNTESASRGAVFPSALQSVSRVSDVGGTRDRLVVVPGQFRGLPDDAAGRGVQRLFTSITAQVYYAPVGNTDTTPPRITTTSAVVAGGRVAIEVQVGDPDVRRVQAMYIESDAPSPRTWKSVELFSSDGIRWFNTAPVASGATEVDYFLQVVDSGGNVSVSSDKGTNFRAEVAPVVPPAPGAPVITLDPATPPNGAFYTDPVTVSAAPGTAGETVTLLVDGTPTTNPVTLSGSGVYQVTASTPGVDPVVRTVVINGAPPSVTGVVTPAPSSTGWYNIATGAPTLTATATPGAFPVASVTIDGTATPGTEARRTVTAQGTTTLSYFATDVRGNASPTQQVTVQVDTVAPTFTCPATPPRFVLNQPNASVTVAVGGATTTSLVIPVATNVVGQRTATGSAVTDQAGNTVVPTCPYVVTYRVSGFFEPVTMGVVNRANAGRAIPVKWLLTDFTGAPVADPTSFVRLALSTVQCGAATIDDIETYATVSTSTLQYNGGGNWQYNWKTDRSLAGSCRVMAVQLKDGSTITAVFRFT